MRRYRFVPNGEDQDEHMNKAGAFFIALTFFFCFLQPNSSNAESALAIGSTGNVAKDGVAIGAVVNRPTKEKAIAAALEECQLCPSAKLAAQRCKVITTFTRQCFATAFDPKKGTPGAGFAIGPDKQSAEAIALAVCQMTAGIDRVKYCVVTGVSEKLSTEVASSTKGTVCDTQD